MRLGDSTLREPPLKTTNLVMFFWGEVSDSESDSGPATSTASELLVAKLLSLHMYNKISAEDCCVSLHYASLTGIKVLTGKF
jgi:hypothetical protein